MGARVLQMHTQCSADEAGKVWEQQIFEAAGCYVFQVLVGGKETEAVDHCLALPVRCSRCDAVVSRPSACLNPAYTHILYVAGACCKGISMGWCRQGICLACSDADGHKQVSQRRPRSLIHCVMNFVIMVDTLALHTTTFQKLPVPPWQARFWHKMVLRVCTAMDEYCVDGHSDGIKIQLELKTKC